MQFLKKNGIAIVSSFILPVSIVALSYLRLGIYPTSNLTILTSDGFGQLVNFFSGFNNALHGEQSLLYTWTGSLGLNFVSLMSYYVNSVFSFIVIFFDNIHMPDAMYVIFLAKVGAMGTSFWIFAHNTYRLPQWIKISFSMSYALTSFVIAYSIFLMWMDALVYLPLILLGIHRLMDEKKPVLLFVSYFLLFVSNYYVAFMVGLFSFFYFFARLFTNNKRYKSSIFPYLLTSLLAGGASMVIILPTIIDLRLNGEKLEEINSIFTQDLGPWDLIVKSMPGVYDTSKYGSGPFIYIGLLPLIFCVFYFVSKKICLKNKIIYGSLLFFMILSVYVNPLNLLWQGFHAPYMFLFRFSFLISSLVIILAGFGIEKYEKSDLNVLVNIILVIGGVFLLAVIVSNKKRYGYITQETVIVTFSILVIFIVLFLVRGSMKKGTRIVPYLFIILVFVEASFNTYHVFLGLDQEWGYVKREKYAKPYKDIEMLVKQTQKENTGFYRLENLDSITRTDSFNYNYSGITMFSSVRNRHSSEYLNSLGYRSLDTNLVIMYNNNTVAMDALMGVKYNLAKENPNKFGFKKIQESGSYSLYENKYALPLGILADEDIYKERNNSNQSELIQYLSEMKEPVYQFTGLNELSRENMQIREEGDFTFFSEESNRKAQEITWEISVPANTQAYINLDSGYPDGMGDANVEVLVNGQKNSSHIISTGSSYNIGYYRQETKAKVTVKFSGQSVIRLIRPSVLLLQTDRFDSAIKSINKKAVSFNVSGNKAKAKVDLEKEKVIFTTIPYEQGWQATIDGKPVKIKPVKDALIALKVPKGKHTIHLAYYPKGLKLGSGLLICCSLLFSIYVYFNGEKNKKIKLEEE